jgi:mannose-1-phosphate guanylyltransferase
MYTVILAGGSGTRLWPRSRQAQPKQFTDITGSGRTMIQSTVDRVTELTSCDQIYVVTGEKYAALVGEQLPEMPSTNIIVEPSGRNTAPAIGLACVHLMQRDPQAVVAILPADHIIMDPDRFRRALCRGSKAASEGYLVTLGITPDSPHTGYGYIQSGETLCPDDDDSLPVYAVRRFAEKPNRTTAEAFLAEGNYYWNGGIFIFRVDVMMAEIERQIPDLYVSLQEIAMYLNRPDASGHLDHAWARVPNVSIDYGVMEGAQRVAMVPLLAGWNDVGSWDALQSVMAPDDFGNYIAQGETLAINSVGNIVYSHKEIIALIGVHDLVVVDTGDALLLGNKNQMQKVKDVVEYLRNGGHTHLL